MVSFINPWNKGNLIFTDFTAMNKLAENKSRYEHNFTVSFGKKVIRRGKQGYGNCGNGLRKKWFISQNKCEKVYFEVVYFCFNFFPLRPLKGEKSDSSPIFRNLVKTEQLGCDRYNLMENRPPKQSSSLLAINARKHWASAIKLCKMALTSNAVAKRARPMMRDMLL